MVFANRSSLKSPVRRVRESLWENVADMLYGTRASPKRLHNRKQIPTDWVEVVHHLVPRVVHVGRDCGGDKSQKGWEGKNIICDLAKGGER